MTQTANNRSENWRGASVALLVVTLLGSGVVCDSFAEDAKIPLEVWFIRHAESEVNVASEPGVPDEGVTYPLTVKGVAQANRLADTFEDVPVTAIYSSIRLRTLQTADAIAFRKGLALNLAPEIVEIGVGAEASSTGGELEEVRAIVDRWRQGEHEVRFGKESLIDIRQRVMPFWERLVATHRFDEGVVVVVTHGGIMGLVLPVLCDNMSIDFTNNHPMPNTGVLKAELRGDTLRCTDWNGLSPDEEA